MINYSLIIEMDKMTYFPLIAGNKNWLAL